MEAIKFRAYKIVKGYLDFSILVYKNGVLFFHFSSIFWLHQFGGLASTAWLSWPLPKGHLARAAGLAPFASTSGASCAPLSAKDNCLPHGVTFMKRLVEQTVDKSKWSSIQQFVGNCALWPRPLCPFPNVHLFGPKGVNEKRAWLMRWWPLAMQVGIEASRGGPGKSNSSGGTANLWCICGALTASGCPWLFAASHWPRHFPPLFRLWPYPSTWPLPRLMEWEGAWICSLAVERKSAAALTPLDLMRFC